MTRKKKVARRKLTLLELAVQLGNPSASCTPSASTADDVLYAAIAS